MQIVTGGNATNSFAAMLSGEAHFSQADPMYVPISREKGSQTKVVAQVVARISGAAPSASYSLPAHSEQLSGLEAPPKLIILGPSLPLWTDDMNQERIAKLLPHLRSACSCFWHKVDASRREAVWRMSA